VLNFVVGKVYVLTLEFSCRCGYDDSVYDTTFVGIASDGCAVFECDWRNWHVYEADGSLWLDDMVCLPVSVVEKN